ncbi:MAG: T9SS type A sorting domain-containing protein [Saprospiraceae bacterium]
MKMYLIILLCIAIDLHILTAQEMINGILSGQIDSTYSIRHNLFCDTIFSFYARDQIPVGLAFDGVYLYSASQSQVIYKFNLNGQLMDSIPYPGLTVVSGDMDFDGTYLWVVVEQEGKLYKLNPGNGDVITSMALPSSDEPDPDNFGCAIDNGYIWVTEYIEGTLLRINLTTGVLVDSFVINRRILPLKIIRGELYGIDFNSHVEDYMLLKFDKSTGAVIDSIPWCLNEPLGFTLANERLWGLSSGFNGTQRIYQFQNLLSATENINSTEDIITVYPNPTSENVTVSSTGMINRIEIYNAIGNTVISMPEVNKDTYFDVDVSFLQKGIYFIRIQNGHRSYVEKILIQ